MKTENHAIEQALQNALARQSEIALVLLKASADMAEIVAFINSYHKMHSLNASSTTDGLSAQKTTQKTTGQVGRKLATPQEVEGSLKAAREAVGQHNKPLTIGPLYKSVAERGFPIDTIMKRSTTGQPQLFNLAFPVFHLLRCLRIINACMSEGGSAAVATK